MTAIAKLVSTRILVAHDHPALRSHIRNCLETLGYDVTEVESCKQAANAINTCKFSVMVINCDTPDFISEAPLTIRQSTINKDTPCILLAKVNSLTNHKKDFDPKIDDYILKPFKNEDLARRIDAVLNPMHYEPTRPIGSMTMCSIRGTVTISGLTSKLPKRQQQVLSTLAKHAPRVVALELITDAIGLHQKCKSSTDIAIQSTIFLLRKRLRNINSDVQIKTVRGCGYRIQISQTKSTK